METGIVRRKCEYRTIVPEYRNCFLKMAAEERVSPFPLPPSDYYKLYTDENIKAGIAPEPPPPIRGEYSVFGLHFEVKTAM